MLLYLVVGVMLHGTAALFVESQAASSSSGRACW